MRSTKVQLKTKVTLKKKVPTTRALILRELLDGPQLASIVKQHVCKKTKMEFIGTPVATAKKNGLLESKKNKTGQKIYVLTPAGRKECQSFGFKSKRQLANAKKRQLEGAV